MVLRAHNASRPQAVKLALDNQYRISQADLPAAIAAQAPADHDLLAWIATQQRSTY